MIETKDDQMNTEPKPQKIIEMKLPLVYLISAVVAICGFSFATYTRFDNYGREIGTLTQSIQKLDTKTDLRDERLSALLQTTIEIKAQLSEQDRRLLRTEGDIKELRGNVEEIRRNQRWMPK